MSALAGDTQAELAVWYQRSLRPRLRHAVARGAADQRQAAELDRLLDGVLAARPALMRPRPRRDERGGERR